MERQKKKERTNRVGGKNGLKSPLISVSAAVRYGVNIFLIQKNSQKNQEY